VKLSEHSQQVAYSAGLGIPKLRSSKLDVRQLATVPVAARHAGARARCEPAQRPLGSARVAYAALVERHTVIRKQPQGRSSIVGRAELANVNGFRQVLAVLGVHRGSTCKADWFRVELPVLPNGTTGWVRAWALQTYRVRSRIVVDVSQRRLRLFRSGKLAFETPVAVGASATPTPLGRFFVDERYVLPDARGPFGPNALGISAHSDALKDVWVEDGPIGIHGTNEPSSIGHAASHGCVRVANDVMRRLFPLAPAGTPVIVTA
jgi:lipoprotein-anchoring transpeptidase ErfK/SrfK